MKTLVLILNVIICFAAADNLRHRELANKVMCLDLGKRRGIHNMKVTKKKYYNKLIKNNDVEGGECTEPTKKLKSRLSHAHEFCKVWGKDSVTLIAPEGMRKWLIKEVGATKGDCGADETNVVEIFE